jgi:hypothetical protein
MRPSQKSASHNFVDMSTAQEAVLVQPVSNRHRDIGTIVDQRRRLALRAFLTIRSWWRRLLGRRCNRIR